METQTENRLVDMWTQRWGGENGKNGESNMETYTLLLLLLLSHFSRVRLCATPQTAARQAPCPWDSPGKNTGVGCHFLLQCMNVKSEREVTQSCLTLSDPMDCSLPGSSIAFSRQEYWSGSLLPSPLYKWVIFQTLSEKLSFLFG